MDEQFLEMLVDISTSGGAAAPLDELLRVRGDPAPGPVSSLTPATVNDAIGCGEVEVRVQVLLEG